MMHEVHERPRGIGIKQHQSDDVLALDSGLDCIVRSRAKPYKDHLVDSSSAKLLRCVYDILLQRLLA
jgi:hypothetical protein